MRAQFRRSRLVTSLVSLVLVMSSARAHAQSADVASEARPQPELFRPVASLDDISRGAVGPHLFTQRLFDTAESLAGAQSTAPPRQRRDSVLNGVLIGAGIGALLGLIPDYYDDCEECHDSLYASIAVGAGIGLVIDVLRSNRRPPSPSQSDAGFRLGVAGGRRAMGIRGVLVWR